MDKTHTRVGWIDAARGIGIILVVLGHAERGIVDAHIAQGAPWRWMDFALYTFHMPLFFLLSGINVPGALKRGSMQFVRTKLWTIAYPYVLWSLVQGFVLLALSGSTNGHLHESNLLEIGWKPISQFWFLYVLMICQLLAIPLAQRPRLLAGIAVLSLLASGLLVQDSLPERLLHSFFFFAAGILASSHLRTTAAKPDARLLWGSIAGWALSTGFAGQFSGLHFDSLWAFPSAILGITAVIAISKTLDGHLSRMMMALGIASMTIYILHIMFTGGTRIVMAKLGVPPQPIGYLLVITAVGVMAPYVLHRAFQRYGLLAPLGLAPLRPRSIPTR